MRKHLLFLVFTIWSISIGNSQEAVPADYFQSPLDIPLVLAGTFGELRSNHFHSGVDIKTQKKQGLNVLAAAEGSVSRIKIAHYGYGKALYLTHPNGYTTVYAHLQKFSPAIEAYIKKKQYKKENFEIELFPNADLFKVSKGEVIGYSGNTGSSGGPHLHFEIRDRNSRPMNPFLFGMDILDTKKPKVTRVLAYPLDDNATINQSANPIELRITQQPNGDFKAENINALGRIGFGVSTIDQQDLANNKNGIYSIQTEVNGEDIFKVQMDKFSFSETRYLNRMIDYSFYQKKKSRVQKLFIEKNNPLSIYKNVRDDGALYIGDGLSYEYNITITDYKKNTTRINIPILGKTDTIKITKQDKSTDHYAYSNQSYSFKDGKFNAYIPKGALYEDTFLDLKVSGDILTLHNKETPLHKSAIISYDISDYTVEDREKLYLGTVNDKGEVYYTGAKIKEGRLSCSTRKLGTYSIGMDKTAPTISPQNIKDKKWMSNYRYLKFKIDDTKSGIKGYRATVNGKFILMEYDYKTKSLVHDFNDNVVTDTENNLKLIVTDNVGNSSTFETTFFRKK